MAVNYKCQACGYEFNITAYLSCPKCGAEPFSDKGESNFNAFDEETELGKQPEKTASTPRRVETAPPKTSQIYAAKESVFAAKVSRTQSKLIERYMSGIQIFGILSGLLIAGFGIIKIPETNAKVAFTLVGLVIAISTYISAALTRMIAAYINFKSLQYLEDNREG